MAKASNRSTSNRSHGAQAEAKVRDDAAKLGDDISGVAQHAADVARNQYEHLKGSAQQFVDQGRERAEAYVDQGRELASDYLDQGRERAVDLQRRLEERIRDQPVQAVLAAVGVGFVLGLLFTRR